MIQSKGLAWNNLNNDGAGFLFLMKPSQEAHRWSTQRLRWFCQEQKDQPECSSYFMRVSYSAYPLFCPIAELKVLIYTCKHHAFALLLYMRMQSEQLRFKYT
jgi:hypothetical protein